MSQYRSELGERAKNDTLACIGCNDCLLACPLPEAQTVTIASLNAAVHLPVIQERSVVEFVTACTQCQQCVPACPADLSRARMVLYNKLKVEEQVADYELLLQAKNVTIPSGWTLNGLAESLTSLSLFAGTESSSVRRLLMKSTLRFLVPGESLCAPGEFLERLCVVLSGSVEQQAPLPGGGTQPILMLAPGSFFGESGILGQAPEPFGVRAQQTSIVLMAPKVAVFDLMEHSPAFRATIDGIYARSALGGHLRSPGALGALPESALERLLSSAQLSVLSSDETLVSQGGRPQEFFLVRAGFLRVSVRDASSERTLVYCRPGDLVGLLDLMTSAPASPYTVSAAGRAEVIRFSAQALYELLTAHPGARGPLLQAATTSEELARSPEVGRGPISEGRASVPPKSAEALVEHGIAQGREVLVVDQTLCTACGNCIASCERRHGYGRLKLQGQQVEQYLFPTACRHCEDPKCLMCSVSGIVRLPSGEIQIVEDNCIGCGACAQRCPYGNISMHPLQTKRKNPLTRLLDLLSLAPLRESSSQPAASDQQRIAVKCDLCAEFKDYACVTACPVGAAFRVDPRSILDGSAK